MKKWIRWSGLVVFMAVMLVFSILWFFFVDGFVERMIEKTGARIVGARVDLDDVNLSLFPAGLSLTRLQVTDPDKPMTNSVDIQQIILSLDSLNLIRRKIIIDDMAVEGVRFGTPRKTSGAIVHRKDAIKEGLKKPGQKGSKFKLPEFQVPNVQDILAKEELQSLKLVESLRADIQTERKNWRKRMEDLPGKKKFNEYQSRIDKFSSRKKDSLTGILGGVSELKSLREDINRDLEMIKRTRKEFDEKSVSLRKRIGQAKKAPLEDIRRLKEKYGFSAHGAANISKMLLGPKISQSVDKALQWYQKLKPVLERAKKLKGPGKEGPQTVKPLRARGVDVRFKEHAPLPDFLIHVMNTSLQLHVGNLRGKIKHITPDQDVLGIPLMFAFSGDNLKGLESVKLEGELNHIDPSKSKDTANLRVRGYQVEDFILSESEELPVVLKKALADLKLSTKLSGNTIDANMSTRIHSARISTQPKKEAGSLAKAVSSTLSGIKKLNIKADISGTLDDYHIRLSSDLDRVLKNAIGNQIKEQGKHLDKELNKAISKKMKGPLDDIKKSLGDFDGIGGELSSRLREGNGLLKGMKSPF